MGFHGGMTEVSGEIDSFAAPGGRRPAHAAGLRATLGPALLILGLTILAYLPAVSGLFLWDDDHHFSENPLMTAPGGLWALWTQHAFYYPLTSTTFWLARRLWGLSPVPYHQLNILLHALNAILLWRLLARLKVQGAWLAGAVFALHPVNVQSVAWMTELKNMQSGLFYLLALHAWVGFRENRRAGAYAAALLFFGLALLSKTSTVTLPLALVVIELWRGGRLERRFLVAWLPFMALSAAAGLATVVLHRGMVAGPEWAETPPQRLILAARCLWHYLGKLFWPVPLTFVYPRWTVDAGRWAQWLWVAALPLPVAAAWAARRTWGRPALLALAYFAASLLPVLNFFRMYYTRYSYVADHWQYLAMMGGVAWLAAGLTGLLRRAQARPAVKYLALAGVLLLLGSLTWRQAGIYQDPRTLWYDTISKNPQAAISYNNLGIYYLGRGEGATARGNVAQGRIEFSKAVNILGQGLARNAGNAELLTIRGAALLYLDQPQAALEVLEQARRKLPDDPEVLNNIGSALAALGREPEARATLERVIQIKPEFPEAYVNLARLLAGAGRRGEARGIIERGLRRMPAQPVLLNSLNGLR